MYSGLLQSKKVILYQLLKMVVRALLALPTQVLAVELEDVFCCKQPINPVVLLFLFLSITLSMMSLFFLGG